MTVKHKHLITFARVMRKAPSKAEQLLWYRLKHEQDNIGKFRRQHPFGNQYIADFISLKHRLVIEIDGGGHNFANDHIRDAFMQKEGYLVLRFNDQDVLNQIESVVTAIKQAVANCVTPSDPLLTQRATSPLQGEEKLSSRLKHASIVALVFVVIGCLYPVAAYTAEPSADDADQQTTGEKEAHNLPRFVTFRAKEANLRTGPGKRYPIDWVINAKGWPVEIIAEFDQWRKVRDWDGDTGWVHRIMLSGKRSALVKIDNVKLHATPSDTAATVAIVKHNAHGQIKTCHDNWCRIEFDSQTGWLPVSQLWGVYANEKLD